ncbi:MAG: M48 family metallopeptidase [Methylococcales bacterium]|nr:M48 family metallopeptidase [Methylococcales bacterium]
MGGLSLAGISLVLLLFFKGVPLFTSWAANQLPTSISKQIGETTFDVFDEYYLEESLLSQARQTEIRQIFQQFVAFHPVGSFTHTPKLYFRQGGEFIGANAFAIPDGTVLVTDELVGFVPNDDALAGIMAHELGHLRSKHGMQSVISTTLVPVFLTLVAGDLLNAASMASTLGILLIDNGYSRDFEREADRHAESLFSWIGLSTQPVADFFQLMILEREKDQEDDGPNCGIALMSTHPSDIERVQFFQDTVTP